MIEDNIHLLEQSLEMLHHIDGHSYLNIPDAASKSGVGGHIRHCLDFYDCFLRGLDTGKIDYDARVRNKLVENDREMAIASLEVTISQLQSLGLTDDLTPVLVKVEGGVATGWSHSSIRRELQFLFSHTVHHFALIAMILRLQGYELPEDFGVAPSTIDYWRQRAA